ncbi:class I SAM-dependent methyltransferase, partial [Micromonospora aurantiaca]|nr:class I SAM-dependent methyltransferase [Micromonospora aurantiaca]
ALVPADFEADEPVGKLTGAGFDASRTALVSWLGVSFYLTRGAVARTLGEIARLAPGTELVMDYTLPDGHRDAE